MLAPLHLAGERLMLCPSGVLSWPAARTLVVADLHLEKGSHFATRGRMLPPYDTRETLLRLRSALRRHAAARLVVLGDSLHDEAALSRIAADDFSMLRRLLSEIAVVWLAGNHDPTPKIGLPGETIEELREGRLILRHIGGAPLARNEAELSGHFHPKATLQTRAGPVTRPCFVAADQRLVLPSFGAYTGGLDARDPAMAPLTRTARRVFLLGDRRLHSVPWGALRGALATA